MALPLIPIITAIGSLVSGPLARWQETKDTEHKAKIARIQSGDNNAAELDRLSIAQRGWKDDYLLLITTAPLVLLFIGPLFSVEGLTEAVKAGFVALESLPEYFWYALGIIYIDTFGFRRMVRVAVERWLDSKFGGSSVVGTKQKLAKKVQEANLFQDGNG